MNYLNIGALVHNLEVCMGIDPLESSKSLIMMTMDRRNKENGLVKVVDLFIVRSLGK